MPPNEEHLPPDYKDRLIFYYDMLNPRPYIEAGINPKEANKRAIEAFGTAVGDLQRIIEGEADDNILAYFRNWTLSQIALLYKALTPDTEN